MSTSAVGFRPPDAKWNKMKAVWDACREAGAEIPKEVEKFFDGVDPGEDPGREVDLGEALTKWHAEGREGFEVNVSKLPKDVKIIRFFNGW